MPSWCLAAPETAESHPQAGANEQAEHQQPEGQTDNVGEVGSRGEEHPLQHTGRADGAGQGHGSCSCYAAT